MSHMQENIIFITDTGSFLLIGFQNFCSTNAIKKENKMLSESTRYSQSLTEGQIKD
jgi:hypothetical protein